jgi:hypothetical protein
MSNDKVACYKCGQSCISVGGIGCICKRCIVCGKEFQQAEWTIIHLCSKECRDAYCKKHDLKWWELC